MDINLSMYMTDSSSVSVKWNLVVITLNPIIKNSPILPIWIHFNKICTIFKIYLPTKMLCIYILIVMCKLDEIYP